MGGSDGHARLLERLDDLRLRLLFGALARAREDSGGAGDDEFENEDAAACALACASGFGGDDDPLLRCGPAAFDRRAVDAQRRRELALPAEASGQATTAGHQADVP